MTRRILVGLSLFLLVVPLFAQEERRPQSKEEGEALRDDERFTNVAAWEHAGVGREPILNLEHLVFENVALTQRSYK